MVVVTKTLTTYYVKQKKKTRRRICFLDDKQVFIFNVLIGFNKISCTSNLCNQSPHIFQVPSKFSLLKSIKIDDNFFFF
jgi:hypothetical protein